MIWDHCGKMKQANPQFMIILQSQPVQNTDETVPISHNRHTDPNQCRLVLIDKTTYLGPVISPAGLTSNPAPLSHLYFLMKIGQTQHRVHL